MRNSIVEQVKDYIRQPYAWPGGYTKVLIMSDGEVICPDCAKNNFKLIAYYTKNTEYRDPWQAAGVDIHWEGEPLQCCHCYKQINPTYSE